MRLRALLLALLTLLVSVAVASRGDRSWTYKQCVNGCLVQFYLRNPAHFEETRPLSRRLTRWSRLDECRYDCQQRLTDIALQGVKQRGLPKNRMTQFHGAPTLKTLG